MVHRNIISYIPAVGNKNVSPVIDSGTILPNSGPFFGKTTALPGIIGVPLFGGAI
jgi:hypothetical protein